MSDEQMQHYIPHSSAWGSNTKTLISIIITHLKIFQICIKKHYPLIINRFRNLVSF